MLMAERASRTHLLATLALMCTAPVYADTGAGPAGPAENTSVKALDEIIVTAQKRSESANSVGISINALSDKGLEARGIANIADLVKAVPSFTYSPTFYATPVYTLRGVGLYDSGFASSPAVSVYVDQVALPYPVLTPGATLDVERVEVLKGPQGTLFGENSTGGAINYIAAKPTDYFTAGGDLTFSRFDQVEVDGYVSGPLTDTLNARVAVRSVQGGAYQESQTRPGDFRGNNDQDYVRLLLDWKPIDRLKVAININAWKDDSETIAPQLVKVIPSNPALAKPILLNSPIAPNDARFADWPADVPTQKRDKFYQLSSREDYSLTDALTLTAITAYQSADLHRPTDLGGTAADDTDFVTFGSLRNVNQELRIAGDTDRVNWLIGVNYDHTNSDEEALTNIPYDTINQPLPFIPPFDQVREYSKQTISTEAAFANIQYKLTDRLSVQAGTRYTDVQHKAANCVFDPSASQYLTSVFNFLQGVFQGSPTGTPAVVIPPHGCYPLDAANGFIPPGVYRQELPEHNISWRGGINYTFANDTLLYLNDSRGYKAGIFPTLEPSTVQQFAPAKQERLDAYELGVKTPLAQRRVELTAAAFFYNYKDKQVRGSILDPIFGHLEELVNVPKSEVWGTELGILARPIDSLTVSLSAAFVHSAVSGAGFEKVVVNLANESGTFGGSELPYSPKITGNLDVQYTRPFVFRGANLTGVLGASGNYQGNETATYQNAITSAPAYDIHAYALLDLRAGFGAPDGSWKILVWGRNITNKFYVNGVDQGSDTLIRYAGEPRTYGVTFSVKH
jgi:iron complex outermembrane receptor protein